MTSPVDTTVKFFHSEMPGAPVLSGTVGAMIAIFDACLVNGFGLQTLDSLIVTGNVAVATKAGHSAEVGTVMLVAGATPAALNGEQKVTATTASTYSFATAGISDQTATGAITSKVAPAGWAKMFSGTNLAAYKPTDLAATGCMVRVDDTTAQYCRLVGYETMSDVNTGTGPFPTTAQLNGGVYWSKSGTTNSVSKRWIIAADGRFFYSGREYYASWPGTYEQMAFGDMVPQRSGDAFSCMLIGNLVDQSNGTNPIASGNMFYGDPATVASVWCARSYTAMGGSVQMRKQWVLPNMGGGFNSGGSAFGTSYGTPYPNPSDGGLYVGPLYLSENTNLAIRGVAPGYWGTGQSVPQSDFAAKAYLPGVSGLPGKTLRSITGNTNSTATAGVSFFDTTGPWR